MTDWTSDDRRRFLQNVERIATVLEERLPPLSEANENERLRAEVERLRAELDRLEGSTHGLSSAATYWKKLYQQAQNKVDDAITVLSVAERCRCRTCAICKVRRALLPETL